MTATNAEVDPGRGVYAISVAAELVGMGSQTLRLYERRGLLEPARSGGGTRRYSSEDLERLRRIAHLVATGLNLAGVAMVLDLQDANARLQATGTNVARKPAYRAGGGPRIVSGILEGKDEGGEAVAEDSIDSSEEIPEADLLEQRSPLDPQSLIDAEREPAVTESPAGPVDEADWVEQQAPVPSEDEDDHPHDSS